MEKFDASEHLDQIDSLVSSLQELDTTDDGREALVSVEAHVTGGLI